VITLITGTPGSGKSLITLQYYILKALLAGRHVYSNIPGISPFAVSAYFRTDCGRPDVSPSDIERLYHDYSYPPPDRAWYENLGDEQNANLGKITEAEFGEFYLGEFPKAPPHSLMVLDEAQKKCYINVKDWREPKNVKFFEYCSVHRHYKHEVLILTQDDGNIDASVNGLREELIYLLRRDRLGWLFRNSSTCMRFLGKDTIRSKPYLKYGLSYSKKMFGLYKSYDVGGGLEIRTTKSIFGNKKLIVFAVLVAVLFWRKLPNFLSYASSGRSLKQVERERSAFVSDSLSRLEFLGPFADYDCSDSLYVLRPDSTVAVRPARGVPGYVCPYRRYVYSQDARIHKNLPKEEPKK
jgi:zona occludens toxin (predicted ATPase)